MKKFKFLILIFAIFLLIGCTKESKESKEVRAVSDFENASTNNGFSVVDNINNYMGVDYITDAKKVELGNTSIEMVVYTDSDSAKKVQDEQIDVEEFVDEESALNEENDLSEIIKSSVAKATILKDNEINVEDIVEDTKVYVTISFKGK